MSKMQFFELEAQNINAQFFIYNWTGRKNFADEIKVIINPFELSFLRCSEETKKSDITNKKEKILSIPFTRTDDSELKTKVLLEDLIKDKDNTNHSYFENLFKDFIWDLKVNEGFQHGNRHYYLSSLFEQYNFIYGICCKLKFDVFCNNKTRNDKSLKTLKTRYWPLSNDNNCNTKSHFATESFEDWIYYLCNAQHEVFFTDERYYEGKNHWFLTLDEELDIVLNHIENFKDKVREPEILANISSNFLTQRYAVDKVIKHYTLRSRKNWIPKITNYLLFASILCIVLSFPFFWFGANECSRIFFWLGVIFFLAPVIFFIYITLSNLSKSDKESTDKMKKAIWSNSVSFKIFLPRLFVGILSGWLVFITTEEIFKMDINITNGMTLTIFICVIGILMMYMYYEIRNIAISAKRSLIFKRVFKILSLSFCISFIIGVVLSMFYFNKMLENESVIKGFYKIEEKADKLDTLSSMDEMISISEEGLEIMDKLFAANSVLRNMEKFWEQTIDFENNQVSPYQSTQNPIILETVKQYLKVNNDLYRQLDPILDTLKLNHQRDTIEQALSSIRRTENNNTNSSVDLKDLYHSNIDLFKFNNAIFIGLLKKFEQLFLERNEYEKMIKNEFSYPNLYKSFLDDHKFVLKISERHYLIPNSLLFRSCMAMFIGIFLQLIIQDRTLTESV